MSSQSKFFKNGKAIFKTNTITMPIRTSKPTGRCYVDPSTGLLPPELRDMIWDNLLTRYKPILLWGNTWTGTDREDAPFPDVTILRTNRAIYNEASAHLYRYNTFLIDFDFPDVWKFNKTLPNIEAFANVVFRADYKYKPVPKKPIPWAWGVPKVMEVEEIATGSSSKHYLNIIHRSYIPLDRVQKLELRLQDPDFKINKIWPGGTWRTMTPTGDAAGAALKKCLAGVLGRCTSLTKLTVVATGWNHRDMRYWLGETVKVEGFKGMLSSDVKMEWRQVAKKGGGDADDCYLDEEGKKAMGEWFAKGEKDVVKTWVVMKGRR